MIRFLIILILQAPIVAVADELKPFITDGCSLFPDGSLVDDTKWLNCCIEHDLAYWKGGSQKDRDAADKELQRCVERVGEKGISSLMHAGVKIGGAPVYPTWYRWGYGWPYARGYKKLTPEERRMVKHRLEELRNQINRAIEELD